MKRLKAVRTVKIDCFTGELRVSRVTRTVRLRWPLGPPVAMTIVWPDGSDYSTVTVTLSPGTSLYCLGLHNAVETRMVVRVVRGPARDFVGIGAIPSDVGPALVHTAVTTTGAVRAVVDSFLTGGRRR